MELIYIILFVMLCIIALGYSFFFVFAPRCSKCNSKDISAFSEEKQYEIHDFHKCNYCGNVDFVNATNKKALGIN